jgi:pilus assembly protein Flp/PilA
MFDHIFHFLLLAQFSAKDAVVKTRNEEGATAVEYGLLVALIAGVIVTAVTLLGTKISGMFTTVTGQI